MRGDGERQGGVDQLGLAYGILLLLFGLVRAKFIHRLHCLHDEGRRAAVQQDGSVPFLGDAPRASAAVVIDPGDIGLKELT